MIVDDEHEREMNDLDDRCQIAEIEVDELRRENADLRARLAEIGARVACAALFCDAGLVAAAWELLP